MSAVCMPPTEGGRELDFLQIRGVAENLAADEGNGVGQIDFPEGCEAFPTVVADRDDLVARVRLGSREVQGCWRVAARRKAP